MILKLLAFLISSALAVVCLPLEDSPAGNSAKPTEQVLGSITSIDAAAHTITVKDDKSGAEQVISLASTRTILKVEPGAKDLKNATRITGEDLAAGDRVSVRGSKAEDGSQAMTARSVVLMSARDLQQARQAQAAEWQNSTVGMVTATDAVNRTLTINVKTPGGPKPLTVHAPVTVEFTRYSPDHPKVASQIGDIEPGDQIRVIGEKSDDNSSMTARKVFSGAFRTVPGLITSISPDGKELLIKNLQTKQPLRIELNADCSVRKLPPPMAMMLARRLNPSVRPAVGASDQKDPEPGRPTPTEGQAGQAAGGGMHGPRNGDLSQLLEHVPPISVSDLKPGDAVVTSGATSSDKSRLFATSIIAGVEPIFQSTPPRQGQSFGGDWSLDMAIPAQ